MKNDSVSNVSFKLKILLKCSSPNLAVWKDAKPKSLCFFFSNAAKICSLRRSKYFSFQVKYFHKKYQIIFEEFSFLE